MTQTRNELITADQFQLGDQFIPEDEAARGVAVVKQIQAGHAHIFQPYIVTEDFSYTGGVLCYIGTREWLIPMTSGNTQKHRLIKRVELR